MQFDGVSNLTMVWKLKTPVAFFIFNRPDTTRQVFDVIRQARPPKLLVVADGPRPEYPDDPARCVAARAVVEQVDWDCEVLTNYAETNLGCRRRVSSGLDWVFQNVSEAIILEDDCVPHPSFFRFCDELLERYRDDGRIGVISGNNFQFGRRRSKYSYYFSRYIHIWGWATWRRAWQYYDREMSLWPEMRDVGLLADILGDAQAERYWTQQFNSTYEGQIDSWAYVWLFSCWAQNLLGILPEVNLVSNIGFGSGATHTHGNSVLANMPTQEMAFPLQHPPIVVRNKLADDFTQAHVFGTSRCARIRARFARLVKYIR